MDRRNFIINSLLTAGGLILSSTIGRAERVCAACVAQAIKRGYRLIDTAKNYGKGKQIT